MSSPREAILHDERGQHSPNRMPTIAILMVFVTTYVFIVNQVTSEFAAMGGQYAKAAETTRTLAYAAPVVLILFVLGVAVLLAIKPHIKEFYQRMAARKRHATLTVGRQRRVSTEQASLTGATRCVNCGKKNTSGVLREWAEEYIFGGVAIWKVEHGENHYCSLCEEADPVEYALRAGKHESLTELSEDELEEIEIDGCVRKQEVVA